MPKIIKNVTDMEIDEVSLVDRTANQHALVAIAKRADTEEDSMPDIKLFDDKGVALPEGAELEDGQIVFDEEGNAYRYDLEDENDDKVEVETEEVEDAEEKELETVGKRSDPFTKQKRTVSKSYSEQVLEELSKAYDDKSRNEVIVKALSRVEELEKRQVEAEKIAKAERTLRLEREYISKAEQYNLPVDAKELGPVLMRMVELMPEADCKVIAKCLESSSDLIFSEIGAQGGGDNQDVMSRVNAFAQEEIGKSGDAGVVAEIFDSNPDAYDMYLAERRG